MQNKLTEQGVSDSAWKLIEMKWKKISQVYESPWQRWIIWCNKRGYNYENFTQIQLTNWLSTLFEEGLASDTINVYSSTISSITKAVTGKTISSTALIKMIMAGIRAARPK